MKFKKREIEIPWEDGAILIFDFPSIPQMVKKNPTLFGDDPEKNKKEAMQNAVLGGVTRIETGLKGWRGIQDHEGKDIPFNDPNREWVIGQVFEDSKLMEKIRIAMGGASPNSKAG